MPFSSYAVVVGYSRVFGGGETCTVDNDSQQFAFSPDASTTTGITDSALRGEMFVLSASTTFTGVSFFIGDNSSDTGTITANLYAYDTGANEPTGSVLASSSVLNSNLPDTTTEFFFEFSSTYSASSGDYCVYLQGSGGGAATIGRQESGAVANAFEIVSSNGGTSWTEQSGRDLQGDGMYGCLN